ncbi:MAG: diphosphomevalonate decarboxylase [Verrucomicrobia bacterium]|nr:MAG: diphosphomevalonate decarboxylase [Verrucomicrobiota bacterium]
MTKREVIEQLLPKRLPAPCVSATAFAPANIALCKYWGKRDPELNLPTAGSLSISLGKLGSEVTLAPRAGRDRFALNGKLVAPESSFARRAAAFLDFFRPTSDFHFEVTAHNTVPTAAGLASSASGFAALTLALNKLFGWKLERRQLSILARLGSGSACRSLFDGFVEWHAGKAASGMDSFAEPLKFNWPDLRVGLVMISDKEKSIGSRDAMQHTRDTSPLYAAWPETVTRDLAELKTAIRTRNFTKLGEIAEGNALAMHATMIAARPSVLYWLPGSVEAIHAVHALRAEGCEVYFTMDAGPNLKLLFRKADVRCVVKEFSDLQVVAPFSA